MAHEIETDPGESLVEKAIERAIHWNGIRRHDLAGGALVEALAREPEDPRLHYYLAVTRWAQGEIKQAESAILRAVGLAPDWPEAYRILGGILEKQGRYVEAERSFLDGLRLDATSVELHHDYAVLMTRAGELDKAERLLKTGLALDPDHHPSHSTLALLLAERKRVEPARKHGLAGLRLAPEEDRSHSHLGFAYLQRGHPFKARRHLREALRLDPENEDLEELYGEADKACRPVYLPMYYWSLWTDRLPGKQFLVWFCVVALAFGLGAAGVDGSIQLAIVLPYVLFCIYTWISGPLVTLWVRIFPPR